MKRFLYCVLGLFCFVSYACKQKSLSTEELATIHWDSIKHSESSLLFKDHIHRFPESNYFDSALYRFDKFDGYRHYPALDCFSECLEFRSYADGSIYYRGKLINRNSIRQRVFDFYRFGKQPECRTDFKIAYSLDSLGHEVMNRTFFFVALYDNDLTQSQEINLEIIKGMQDFKNYLAVDWYKVEYDMLSLAQKESIDLNVVHHVFFFLADYEDNYH